MKITLPKVVHAIEWAGLVVLGVTVAEILAGAVIILEVALQ